MTIRFSQSSLLLLCLSIALFDYITALAQRRALPERLLIGYGSQIDKIREAVQSGVNVVIWAFADIVAVPLETCTPERKLFPSLSGHVTTSLNLTRVADLIEQLDSTGFDHVVHLISFGGWNGKHLEPDLSSDEWYATFCAQLGTIFHGLDWDLEGNDDLDSRYNYFTVDCLEKMVEISEKAKKDGFIVGMAPPQSYLDVHGNSAFSRFVNTTNEKLQPTFHYYGVNVYAYLLAKCEHSIDFVSVQFYESYSRALMTIRNDRASPSEYIIRYVRELVCSDGLFKVDFSQDPECSMSDRRLELPLSKLVLGMANGWAKDSEKTLFLSINEADRIWKELSATNSLPRGFMFWTIDEEGTNGITFSQSLSKIIHS